MKKRTIKKSIRFEGIGIHTGKYSKIILHPSEKNGIYFIKDNVEIPLSIDYVVDTDHGTSIGKDGIKIKTIEHLTSCLLGLSIDNLVVEVLGEEIPAIDGSSRKFCEKILDVGFRELKERKVKICITNLFTLSEEGKFIAVKPSKNLSVTTIVSYENLPVFFEMYTLSDISNYFKEVSRARTFGFLQMKEELKKKGLIKGGNINNLLIFDEKKNINAKRYINEVARHKCLDFLGDLALFGINVKGEFLIFRTGHTLHFKFLKLLKEKEELWNIV